jgi:hypothetical protein
VPTVVSRTLEAGAGQGVGRAERQDVTVDVWHLLGLHFYDRSIQEQRRLT